MPSATTTSTRAAASPGMGPSPRRRRTQGERRATTRQALLDAASGCLIDLGYAGASTTAICQRAGVSQGSLFKYFPTKSVLLGAAAEHLYDRLSERFLAGFDPTDPNDPMGPTRPASRGTPAGAARVERAIHLLWELFQSDEFGASLELEMAARTDASLRAELGPVLTRNAERVRRQTVAFFPDGAGEPTYDRTVDLVLEVMVGMAVSRIADPEPVHYRLLLAHLTELALDAFAPASPTRPPPR